MRNISPEDAKTTNEVLDRILEIRLKRGAPKELSVPLIRDSILFVKTLLAIYQPKPFSQADFTHLIQEANRSKGGHNIAPSTSRPSPPKGQRKKEKL